MQEFTAFTYVFNISHDAAEQIFKDFDVDGSRDLDFEEFQMFLLACLDKQNELDGGNNLKERIRHLCHVL